MLQQCGTPHWLLHFLVTCGLYMSSPRSPFDHLLNPVQLRRHPHTRPFDSPNAASHCRLASDLAYSADALALKSNLLYSDLAVP